MGVIRFEIASREALRDWDQLPPAYMSGLDGRVFPSRFERRDDTLECTRQHSDSGKLHICWPIPGHGRPVMCTSSLRETEEPYLLPLELARGKISQLRNQLSDWQIAGLQVPEAFQVPYRQAHHAFSRAVSLRDQLEACLKECDAALVSALEAANILTQAYAEQRLAERMRRIQHVPLSLGCDLGTLVPDEAQSQLITSAFNTVIVPAQWKDIEPVEGEYNWETYDAQVEWCAENRLLTYGGPLLDLSTGGLPEWLWTWQHDFLNLQSFVSDFVETAISRYLGRIRLWEITARANTGGALALSEENRLALVARSLEIARQVDDEIQLMIRVDQPWGEYQSRGNHRLSALQFVDALHRSGVGVTRINLEISVGYIPQGCASRDLLEFSRLIDLWSCLGLPLQITLAFPSNSGPDLWVNSDLEVGVSTWRMPWSEAAQAAWMEEFLPVLIAKPAVVGVFWNHFSDTVPHRFPHNGLLRDDGEPKPALNALAGIQQKWHPTQT